MNGDRGFRCEEVTALEHNLMPPLVLGVGIILVYFLPTLVAVSRGHRNLLAVFVLNLFLGWTILGWIAALVWAVMRSEANEED